MISFLTGIIVTLVTFYIAFIYASTVIGLLGFAEAVLVLSAFFFLLYLKRQVHAALQIPITVADAGGKVTVKLKAENKSRVPVMRIRYHIRSGNLFERKQRGKWQSGDSVYYGKNVYYNYFYPADVGNYVFELDRNCAYQSVPAIFTGMQTFMMIFIPDMTAVKFLMCVRSGRGTGFRESTGS